MPLASISSLAGKALMGSRSGIRIRVALAHRHSCAPTTRPAPTSPTGGACHPLAPPEKRRAVTIGGTRARARAVTGGAGHPRGCAGRCRARFRGRAAGRGRVPGHCGRVCPPARVAGRVGVALRGCSRSRCDPPWTRAGHADPPSCTGTVPSIQSAGGAQIKAFCAPVSRLAYLMVHQLQIGRHDYADRRITRLSRVAQSRHVHRLDRKEYQSRARTAVLGRCPPHARQRR